MYIARVKLENFKQHKSLEREFTRGVNAIFGPNGAGKTSIIEAIGFALFGYSPYRTQSDFIRKGANKMLVGVDLVAPIDNRVYYLERMLRAKSGGHYKLLDKATSALLCEGGEDVQNRLLELLQLDPEATNLKELFGSILGVPQGTMTAIFLSNSNARGNVFDPLLEVGTYQKTFEKMRSLYINPLGDELHHLEVDMAQLKARAERLAPLQKKQSELRTSLEKDKKQREKLQTREPELQKQIEEMRAWEEAIANNEREQQKLKESCQNLQSLQGDLRKSEEEARKAHAIVEQEKSSYEQHQEAEKKLPALRQKAHAFRLQQDQFKDQESQQEKLQQRLETSEKERTELRALESELTQLEPALEEQKRLQSEHENSQKAQKELEILQVKQENNEEQIKRYKEQVEQQTQTVERLQQLQYSIQKLGEITAEGKKTRERIDELQAQQNLRITSTQERQRVNGRITETTARIEGAQVNLKALEAEYQPLAERLPHDEEKLRKNKEQILQLESYQDREQQFHQQLSGGVCPYFQQTCRNLSPEQSLSDFITGQLQSRTEDLQRLRQGQDQLQRNKEEARRAQQILTERSAQLRAEIQNQSEERERAQIAIREVEANLLQNPDRTAEIERLVAKRNQLVEEYNQVKELETQAKTLGGAQENLTKSLQHQKELENDLEKHKATIQTLSPQAQKLAPIKARLKELEEPCKRGNVCIEQLKKKPDCERRCQELRASLDESKAKLDSTREELKAFGDIERDLVELQRISEATKASNEKYLQHWETAQRLAEWTKQLAEKEKEQKDLERKLQELEVALREVREHFNAEVYRQLLQEERELIGLRSELDTRIRRDSQELEECSQEIAELVQASEKLKEKQERHRELEEVQACSEFIRGIYKRAKPEITKLLIDSISNEAGRIFSQLMDTYRMRLKWVDDEKDRYALVVEESGEDRSFANLSGGEQMAAALALRMALIKELSGVRIAFFDEPTAHMDEVRRRNLGAQLGSIEGFEQLFVISHDDTFDAQTHHTVRVP